MNIRIRRVITKLQEGRRKPTMSAALCGSKRSFFEDLTITPISSSPVSKKFRCSSPIRFSLFPHSHTSKLIDHLGDLFPGMDKHLFEKTLQECGDDLDATIKSLHALRLGSVDIFPSIQESETTLAKGTLSTNGEINAKNVPTSINYPTDRNELVELLVREIINSSCVDDARARASRVLDTIEKSIRDDASSEASLSLHKENIMLKEQFEIIMGENTILKRAVAIQHERQKEFDEKNQELQQLKHLVSQYQEQLRTLEMNNYALAMHLKVAQQNSSIPGHFHPDVF